MPLKPQLDTTQFTRMFSRQNAQLTVTVSELLSSGSLGFSSKEISRGALACDCSVKSPQTPSRDPLHMQMFTQSALAPAGLHLQPCQAGVSTMSPGFRAD